MGWRGRLEQTWVGDNSEVFIYAWPRQNPRLRSHDQVTQHVDRLWMFARFDTSGVDEDIAVHSFHSIPSIRSYKDLRSFSRTPGRIRPRGSVFHRKKYFVDCFG